jgi:hypothetical protein
MSRRRIQRFSGRRTAALVDKRGKSLSVEGFRAVLYLNTVSLARVRAK